MYLGEWATWREWDGDEVFIHYKPRVLYDIHNDAIPAHDIIAKRVTVVGVTIAQSIVL